MPFTTLFIDLDDTLYPESSGLWPAIRARISGFMVERLGIAPADADGLRRRYFETYGTTLRGLEMNYVFDRQDFLAYVHNVDLRAYIGPDPALRTALNAVPLRKFIFTNADVHHADRVTTVLEVKDCFDGVIDTNVLFPHCKPQLEAFQRALEVSGQPDPARCILIDDLSRTVLAARQFGMRGILFGVGKSGQDADAVFGDWSRLGEILRGLE